MRRAKACQSIAALATVAGAATPALLRTAGFGAPPVDYAELPRVHAVAAVASSSSSSAPSKARIQFLGASDDEASAPPPTEVAPGQSSASWAVPRMGLARKKLELRDHAASSGLIVGEVAAGAIVTVVREQGEWVLVAQNGPDDMSLGWAQRSAVTVR